MNLKRGHILFALLLLSHLALGQTDTAPFEPLSVEVQRSYFLGQNHLVKGDLDEAYSSFQFCVEAEPEVAGFHFELGKIDYENKHYESALSYLSEALKLDSKNDWYNYYRGLVQLELEMFDDAWTDLMVWVGKRPGDLESLDFCAELFIIKGELWHAYQAYSYYEDEISENLDIRIKRLMLVLNSQLNERQVFDFIKNAINDFPEEPMFIYEKAGLYANKGEFEKAVPIYVALIKSNPQFLESYMSLAKCHISTNSDVDIYPLLEKAYTSKDIDPTEKIKIVLALSDDDQVKNLLLIALDAHPMDPRLNHFYAHMSVQFGDIEEALLAYERAIKYNPSSVEVRDEYCYLLYSYKDWTGLENASNQALTYFPLEAKFNYYLGFACGNLDDYKRAVKAFKGGLAIVYENPVLGGSMAEQLAMSYREMGEFEKSYDAYEESLEYVEDPYVMNNHAYFLATDRVNIQRALELSSMANEAQPDEPNFLDTQALILYLLDRNEEALVLIQKAQEILGSDYADAVFLEREGDILWELGEYDSAKTKWNEAIEAGGGKKRLNEKLSETTQ